MMYKKPETYYNEETIRSVYRYDGESEVVTDEGQEIFGYVSDTPYLAVITEEGVRVAGDPVVPKYWVSEPTEHSLIRKIFCQDGEFSTPYYKVVDSDNIVVCKFALDDGYWRATDWNDNWRFGLEYMLAVSKLLDELEVPRDPWSWIYEVVICPTR